MRGLLLPGAALLHAFLRMEAAGFMRAVRAAGGVSVVRLVRHLPHSGRLVHISAVDPLNLTGIVPPRPRTRDDGTNRHLRGRASMGRAYGPAASPRLRAAGSSGREKRRAALGPTVR